MKLYIALFSTALGFVAATNGKLECVDKVLITVLVLQLHANNCFSKETVVLKTSKWLIV